MVKKIFVGLALVLILVVGVYLVGPRNIIGMIRYGGQAVEGDLAVGDAAPDVPLVTLEAGEQAPLSRWIADRPLVLVFGSFT